MDKKKLRGYIFILAVCVLASILLPKLLDKAADRMVDGIDEETEVSTENGGTGLSGMLGGESESQTESDETVSGGNADETGNDEQAEAGSGESDGSEISSGEMTSSGMTQTPDDQMQEDGPRTDAEIQAEKEQNDHALQEVRSSFNPTITESFSGLQEAFVGEHEEAFRNAIADHIFQAYGNLYSVTKIELVEFLDETDDEVRCMVRVYTKSGDKSYSQDYIVSYSKAQDFYSVYAYNR